MLKFEDKKKVFLVFLILAVIFLSMYFIINSSHVIGFFNGIVGVLAPIAIGFAIAYILNPIMKFYESRVFKKMRSKRAIRGLSVLCTYFSALLALVAIAFLIVPSVIKSVTDLTSNLDSYIDSATEFVNNIANRFMDSDEGIIDRDMFYNTINNFFSSSENLIETILSYVSRYGSQLVTGVTNVFLGLFISIYVLLSKERLYAQTNRLASAFIPNNGQENMKRYLSHTHNTFGNYFFGVLFDAMIVGILTFILMTIFRIPYAPLVATICAVTNIIPVFGPFIGAIPSAFIIFISDPKKALVFIIMILVIQQIDGNIIAPKILGDSTGISSLGVIIAITVMGAYFGFVGMIVGVPIFAVILSICNEFLVKKLAAKGLATNTEDYYPDYNTAKSNARRKNLFGKLFDAIGLMLIKIKRIIFNKKAAQKIDISDSESEDKENKDD